MIPSYIFCNVHSKMKNPIDKQITFNHRIGQWQKSALMLFILCVFFFSPLNGRLFVCVRFVPENKVQFSVYRSFAFIAHSIAVNLCVWGGVNGNEKKKNRTRVMNEESQTNDQYMFRPSFCYRCFLFPLYSFHFIESYVFY